MISRCFISFHRRKQHPFILNITFYFFLTDLFSSMRLWHRMHEWQCPVGHQACWSVDNALVLDNRILMHSIPFFLSRIHCRRKIIIIMITDRANVTVTDTTISTVHPTTQALSFWLSVSMLLLELLE